ncbi:putative TWO COMPONENT HISTIDINE KINASE [Vibrio nigripulchritudo MADA3029]|uniref:ATP-binding protein n=1 Tax=Vibrio nigripulchritudo TaxID=28173 RepID=UPI0003B243F6|nr:ATP-binding protein [Vibrio nigripulchritudo]CCN48634.1 putative TWO COMPONENT HISTIDINE KINASE [Vibrio nigripulchritudo MADA3020]CCN55498.1 putative TWO COMPONENT HISTIDINE KINASE [Vibrio nigripulchritudo MADA3021]CCN60842.1 putative TWO COMPONENT HISTIDINE KINASE [Vibrio nigripulchritudo MADA3029]
MKIRWKGMGLRLALAMAMLSLTTLIVSALSSYTFSDINTRLEHLNKTDLKALDYAAKLNDKVRLIISTAPLLGTADSNVARNRAMDDINQAIGEMNQVMVQFPDYHAYFKDVITQIGNSLSLLFQSEAQSEQLSSQLNFLLEGLFPLLELAGESLDELSSQDKASIDYATFRSLLYYQSGLAEKLYNDNSFNELDDTIQRLESIGDQWWEIWKSSPISLQNPTLDDQLTVIHNLTSRGGRLFALKDEIIDRQYQQQFFLENSNTHLHQLAVQIERYTNTVNSDIDRSLNTARHSLAANQRIALFFSLISVAAAIAVSWFYVQRNILQRIRQLQMNMKAISSGHLLTPVAISGGDEVTEMAKDLQFFQQTAIEVEQTNKRLEQEVIERTNAERKLRSTQNELIQAGKLAALGELSVGITHEINQPLTAATSHVRSAKLWLGKNSPEKAITNLEKIQVLLAKTASITKHLRAFARKSDGHMEKVELKRTISDAIQLLESRTPSNIIKVKDLPDVMVSANAIRLEQVFVNILGNALDAISTTPEPDISISGSLSENGDVVVSVRDNGSGIKESEIPHIFDPFYTNKETGDGLGLGLSIAYNIIKDFGGSISADSNQTTGTTFTLTLRHQ